MNNTQLSLSEVEEVINSLPSSKSFADLQVLLHQWLTRYQEEQDKQNERILKDTDEFFVDSTQ